MPDIHWRMPDADPLAEALESLRQYLTAIPTESLREVALGQHRIVAAQVADLTARAETAEAMVESLTGETVKRIRSALGAPQKWTLGITDEAGP